MNGNRRRPSVPPRETSEEPDSMTIPIKPIYLLADSQLLFWHQEGRPFLSRIKEDIEKEKPKAAYIGASNSDQPEFFSIFEGAMQLIGIEDCRMIYSDYQDEDRTFLKGADIILLAGGDVAQGWRAIDQTGMGQDIIQKYYDNTVLIGVSAGAVQLGLKGWESDEPDEDDLFDTFKLIPFVVDAHDEAAGWERLKTVVSLSDSYTRGLGLPSGGGLIYHTDHALEPVRQSVTEFGMKGEDLVRTLLFPPTEKEEEQEEEGETED